MPSTTRALEELSVSTKDNMEMDEDAAYIRHPDLWFADGSIILQAETTRFRVHTSVLARKSQFFRDMFSLPQPQCASSSSSSPKELTRLDRSSLDSTVVDGCPLLVLHDSAEDLANLLVAFYDGATFGDNDREDFQVVSGILRLATKYAIDSLREEAITHLSIAWPMSLKGWDAREELASLHEVNTGLPHGSRYPSPLDIINLAQEVNAPTLLPSAFYDLSRYHFTQIFEQSSEEPLRSITGSNSMSLSDIQRLTLGKEASQQCVASLIHSMRSINHYLHSGSSSPSGGMINAHRRRASCTSAMACRKEFSELVQLATQHYLFDREKGCADPLYVAEELGQLKSAEFSECEPCARALESWAARERVRIWKLVPSWFRLDSTNMA